jgi:PAT family beta-lactamase induction signal transducer AmpG
MRLPNLLATRNGRLAAFFCLYLTEGIPLGFTATAVATQMRRQGLGPEAIGVFVASLYAPWTLKWAMGPFVDVFSSDRFGRRRTWIVAMQVLMVATLLFALPVNFTTELKLFTTIILFHNIFGATQDIAIDALACGALREEERGLANGLMFSGAYLGQAAGGAGVLLLTPIMGFSNTFYVVAAWILAVTLFVAMPLREVARPLRARDGKSRLATAVDEVVGFLVASWRAFTGSRAALLGVLFALLPAGAYALGLALQSNLAVELGLSDTQFGVLNLWTTISSALGCVVGGWLSDRLGRRRTLFVFIAAMSIPTALLAFEMQRAGWILPVDMKAEAKRIAPAGLVSLFWFASISYAIFNGLMYGVRSALFMDITTPAVAATQFTAYMAMLNIAILYSARWQGWAVERWGYPLTLGIDAAAGLLCLALLPLLGVRRARAPAPGAAIPEAVQP